MRLWNLLIATPILVTAAWAQSGRSAVQETRRLNHDQVHHAARANARHDAQMALYHEQMQRWQAQKARYAADRARYRKGEGRSHDERLRDAATHDLIGAPLEAVSGRTVGHIDNITWMHNGRIYALRATLKHGHRHVWLNGSHLQYDPHGHEVMTGMARHALYAMAKRQD